MTQAAWSVGIATAMADNIANNLPVGLVAGSVAARITCQRRWSARS